MSKVLAKRLRTYPNEEDMLAYAEGNLEPCDVRINYKGGEAWVNEEYYSKEYYKVIEPKVYKK